MSVCLTLKKSNCKNCYKCIRHCPVKSIRFSGNQAHIIPEECILCGQCFVVCPQGAKEIVSDLEKVKVMLQSGSPVYVSLAPSFIANYDGTGIEAMRDALKKLGFTVVKPSGTFYIFPKALEEDANAFCKKAMKYDLALVPGDSFGCPGYFRMAYCIDTEKVRRSFAALEKFVAEEYGK